MSKQITLKYSEAVVTLVALAGMRDQTPADLELPTVDPLMARIRDYLDDTDSYFGDEVES